MQGQWTRGKGAGAYGDFYRSDRPPPSSIPSSPASVMTELM